MSNENTSQQNTNDPSKKTGFWKKHGKKVMIGAGAVAVGVAGGAIYYACRSVGVDAAEAISDIKDAATGE